jgi:putative Ca2+/H+ antiporter (TMEM165/GDT1 family)
MEAFFISTIAIASAEFGDKTQLLALLFATRFKKPVQLILAIFIAILVNHGIAAFFGEWISAHLQGAKLHALLATFFILAGVWSLKPDTLGTIKEKKYQTGIFLTAVITFFLAEMGDKTQIATALLAAQFQTLIPVILGSTLGILLVSAPVVFLGDKLTYHLPINYIRIIACAIFLVLGIKEIYQLATSL